MQKELKLSELKTLLISAKNELNSMLSLNRAKKIKYEEQQYFELVTFLSLWNVAGENGSKDISITLNEISGGRAEIVYKMLVKPEEEKLLEEEIKKEEKIEERPIIEEKEKQSKVWVWLLGGLGFLLVGLVIGYFYIKRKE